MKVWKKLSAVALALMMVLALCVMASADGPVAGTLLTGTNTATGANINGTSFTVTLTNEGTPSSNGYRETETVTYMLKAANGTDAIAANTVTFASGDYSVDTNNTTATVTFAASQTDEAASAVTLNLSFGSAITPESGQRYAKYAIVQDGNTDVTYYLYVYVKIDGTTYTPFAAILVNNDTFNPEGSADSTDNQAYKVAGFAPTYTAKNVSTVTISKALSGNNTETTKDFNFNVTVTCGTVIGADSSWTYSVTPYGNATWQNSSNASTISYSTTGQEFSATMRGGDNIVIAGLPDGSKVEVKELNTGTYAHDYEVTSAVTGSKAGSDKSGSVSTANSYSDSSYQTFITTNAGTDATIAFTNTRDVISPTGVVLRYAPYLAMLGAGIVVVPLSHRKKEEE